MYLRIKAFLKAVGLFYPLRRLYRPIQVRFADLLTSDAEIAARQLVPATAYRDKLVEIVAMLRGEDGSGDLGDYLEFGVYNGTSLACAYGVGTECGLEDMRYFGFDSFEGLPAGAHVESDGEWGPGELRCSLEMARANLARNGVDWSKVFLIKGWFSETLRPKTIKTYGLKKASIIMVDCVLYSSTVELLRFVEPLIQDRAVLLFDDWGSGKLDQRNMGEKRAFTEFIDAHPQFDIVELDAYNKASRIFRIARRAEVASAAA